MESEFSKFDVKWLLAPRIASEVWQEEFEHRLKFDSPFRVRGLDGGAFRAELEVDEILYTVNGKTSVNSDGDMEFSAEGEVALLGTALDRILPALVNIAKQLAINMILIFGVTYLVLRHGPQTDLGQWLISKSITPWSAAIYVTKWILFIDLFFGVIAVVWRISKLRATSRQAGERVENWLGATEQQFRHQKTGNAPTGQPAVVIESSKRLEQPQPLRPSRRNRQIMYVFGGIVAVGVIGAIFNHNAATLAARCKVISVQVKPDVFITNGEADAGYSVFATIANNGAEGSIRIRARLETSEGLFTREQDYTLSGNTSREFSFGFPEPTINATNIQGWVGCSPD